MINYIITIVIIVIIFLLYKIFIKLYYKNIKNKQDSSKSFIIQDSIKPIIKQESLKPIIKKEPNKKESLKPIIKQESNKKESLKPIIKKESNKKESLNNNKNKVYLMVSINNKKIGKIIIELFDKIVPKTCHNFRTLCKTKKYVNCPFHRIIKDFMIQGGDFTNFDGTGGTSIYGKQFDDENFELKHDEPYLLSMANSGPNTNGSQFFITTTETPHLNNKHVVFGKVIKGFELVDKLNNVNTHENDNPIDNILISDCGII